jgi:outer membrane protein OmpA-like peptidoglycan-associated protein
MNLTVKLWPCLVAIVGSLPLQTHAAEPASAKETVILERDIEKALTTKPKTRGLRIQGTTESRAAPAIDLNIPFEFNSSELQTRAVAQLRQLQTALESDALAQDRFLVAGHTDAKGDAEYNRELSLRRAESVKRYLVANGIAAQRLETQGLGEDSLLTPDSPDDGANRRVEIRNLGTGDR